MPKYIFAYTDDSGTIGFYWIDNANSTLEAFNCLDNYLKLQNKLVRICPKAIVVNEFKVEEMPEDKETAFDSLVNVVELVYEIGLKEFDRKSRQAVQFEFNKLLEIGQDSYLDRRILPSMIDEVREILKKEYNVS